jgi:hypothetical protein
MPSRLSQKLADLDLNIAKRNHLYVQLRRQIKFEETYGIKPHHIRSIAVRGPGGPTPTMTLTMKDGSTHTLGATALADLTQITKWAKARRAPQRKETP